LQRIDVFQLSVYGCVPYPRANRSSATIIAAAAGLKGSNSQL
jgi:hypothetical protein